jgi:Domain of unknown function (DUF4258)
MREFDVTNLEAVQERIYAQAATENIRITQHAQQEMVEEDITLDEVLQAIARGQILENYPEHRRGAYCLLNGHTQNSRLFTLYVRQHDPCLLSSQFMNQNHRSG